MDHDERPRDDRPIADDRGPDAQPVERTADPAPVADPVPSRDETQTYTTPSSASPSGEALPPSEIESWPSQDARSDDSVVESTTWGTRPPDAASSASDAGAPWPTEPPVAGSAAPDAWPTAAPERGAPAVGAPDAIVQSPPSELEAYPATSSDARAVDAPTGAVTAGAHSVPAAESATGESTQCPRCGTENRPGLAFCRNCGQRLVAAGVATTVERPGTPEGTQACPRCGTHNRAGVAFCQNCGANLRGTAAGYVPPTVATEAQPADVVTERRGAVLGPVVLLIGLVGIITAYLLPFLYGSGSLFERAFGAGGYGVGFWNGYPEVGANLADQAYFGLAAPAPLLGLLLLGLAIAGFARARPGMLQQIGLVVALLWSVGLVVLFLVVELAANWDGDLVGLLRQLTPAGIIFFLSGLIVIIGALTRFGRS